MSYMRVREEGYPSAGACMTHTVERALSRHTKLPCEKNFVLYRNTEWIY